MLRKVSDALTNAAAITAAGVLIPGATASAYKNAKSQLEQDMIDRPTGDINWNQAGPNPKDPKFWQWVDRQADKIRVHGPSWGVPVGMTVDCSLQYRYPAVEDWSKQSKFAKKYPGLADFSRSVKSAGHNLSIFAEKALRNNAAGYAKAVNNVFYAPHALIALGAELAHAAKVPGANKLADFMHNTYLNSHKANAKYWDDWANDPRLTEAYTDMTPEAYYTVRSLEQPAALATNAALSTHFWTIPSKPVKVAGVFDDWGGKLTCALPYRRLSAPANPAVPASNKPKSAPLVRR